MKTQRHKGEPAVNIRHLINIRGIFGKAHRHCMSSSGFLVQETTVFILLITANLTLKALEILTVDTLSLMLQID